MGMSDLYAVSHALSPIFAGMLAHDVRGTGRTRASILLVLLVGRREERTVGKAVIHEARRVRCPDLSASVPVAYFFVSTYEHPTSWD